MRVCVVNDRFSTSAPGGVYRIQGIAGALGELGHEVVQVCPFFTVHGLGPYPDTISYGNRFTSFVWTPVDLVRRLRVVDADVYLVELPFPWTKAFVGIAEAAFGNRVFLDFGESWVEAANRLHRRIATRVLRSALRSAIGASATTAALRQALIDLGRLGPERVLYLPCGVASDFLGMGPRAPDRSSARDGVVVGYMGTLSEAQGCRSLVDLVTQVHDARPDARFLVVGDGPLLEPLRARAQKSGLDGHISFTGGLPRSELPNLVRGMDIGLSLKPNRGTMTIGTFPQKIPEYMAVGCVPVSTPLLEARNIITDHVDGIISEVASMPDAIVSLLDDDATRKRMSAAAAASARARFRWSDLVTGLLDFWKRAG